MLSKKSTDYCITAIVPVYIRVNYLEEALRSILNQTYQPREIIIVDDGSPEPVRDYLTKFDFFERLRIVRSEENLGVSGARNLGFNSAASEWVAYLDSDDSWVPEKLQVQVDYLRDHPDCDGVDGYMKAQYPSGWESMYGEGRRSLCLPDALRMNQIFNQMLLIRRSALEAAGGFDTGIKGWDDHAISIRLAAAGVRIDHIPRCLGFHRRHPGNQSGKAVMMVKDGLTIWWRYRHLYIKTFGRRSFIDHTAFVMQSTGGRRGKILGRGLKYAGRFIGLFGSGERAE